MGTAAQDREDHVLASFLAYLRQSGVSADLIERPDRTPDAQKRIQTITTDALLDVHRSGNTKETWAVDVTALALPPDWYPALHALDERFTALAEKHQLLIRVNGTLPPAPEVAGLVTVCENAIQEQGTTGAAPLSERIDAQWVPAPVTSAEDRLDLFVWMPTTSALLSDQIADSLRPTLTRKMNGQGRRAQEAGAKYIILLDWAGGDHIAQGTHWLPQSPYTVQTAVTDVLSGLPMTPDALYLFDRDDHWHLVEPST